MQPRALLGTVWMLSKFAAQMFGKPSPLVNTTSVAMLRIVEVIGAIVTEFSTAIPELRVRISTGPSEITPTMSCAPLVHTSKRCPN